MHTRVHTCAHADTQRHAKVHTHTHMHVRITLLIYDSSSASHTLLGNRGQGHMI